MKPPKIKRVTFHISRSGSGEPFHWTPVTVPHLTSMARVEYDKDGKYRAKHFFVPLVVQWFWLGLIFAIRIHPQFLSEQQIMMYHDTVNAELEKLKYDLPKPS